MVTSNPFAILSIVSTLGKCCANRYVKWTNGMTAFYFAKLVAVKYLSDDLVSYKLYFDQKWQNIKCHFDPEASGRTEKSHLVRIWQLMQTG
jgi:hypothetical protein